MYTDYDWNLGRSHCPIPYIEPTIEADGNVWPSRASLMPVCNRCCQLTEL